MVPGFDLQGGAALIAARDASVMALLSAFGTIVFRNLVAPPAFERLSPEAVAALKRRLLWLAQASVAAGVVALGGWLVVEADNMADADTAAEAFAAVPAVLGHTAFGHVLVLQLVALLVLALVLGWRDGRRRQRLAFAVAAAAVALQAGHSHAFSMDEGPSLLLACDVVHLLGAGAWLGGLVPLLLAVWDTPPRAGAMAARRFSPVGQCCVAGLAVTAAIQGWVLVGSIPGLVGSAYGWMVLVKLGLFGVLLGFAAANRYRFAPALLRDDPEPGRRVLLRSLVLQTCAGLAVIVAAVVLSDLPPAMHVEPVWPFSERLSLAAVREDPDFLREVVEAGLALAGALAVLAASLLLRRRRLAALALAASVAWFAVPHFDLLLVDAYPTSFYHSPTGFSSETIVEGGSLFAQRCAACHGTGGRGDGPLAKTLKLPPADLTAGHLWMHSDGELFWWLSHGIEAPEGGLAMPGFADVLSEDQRWALIDYIRANNAGTARRDTGAWPQAVQAPGLEARCGERTLQLADLRGQFVRLVIGPVASAEAGVVTIAADGSATPPPGVCIARDEAVPAAYAIVSGIMRSMLPGTQFLIDGEGWLRAVQPAGELAGWNDPKALAAEIIMLRDHPVAMSNGPMDHMNMKM